MDSPSTTAAHDKQVTIAVPEDRVAEFYAFYARFLAGRGGRFRGGPHGHHRHSCHRGHEAREQGPVPADVTV